MKYEQPLTSLLGSQIQAIPARPSIPGTSTPYTHTSLSSRALLMTPSTSFVETFSPFHLREKVLNFLYETNFLGQSHHSLTFLPKKQWKSLNTTKVVVILRNNVFIFPIQSLHFHNFKLNFESKLSKIHKDSGGGVLDDESRDVEEH